MDEEETTMFEPLPKLLLGLVTGIVFGFLLQKGRVAKHRVIVDQFRLRDFTVLKIMATAIVVGGIGVYALASLGVVSLHIKPALWGGVLAGGVFFGLGIVVLGYCPGTTFAAAGEGHRDAIFGIAGMFAGALLFVLAYPALKPLIEGLGDGGKLTWPDVTGLSAAAFLLPMAVALIMIFVAQRNRSREAGRPARSSTRLA
jgi:uncharacterized protein